MGQTNTQQELFRGYQIVQKREDGCILLKDAKGHQLLYRKESFTVQQAMVEFNKVLKKRNGIDCSHLLRLVRLKQSQEKQLCSSTDQVELLVEYPFRTLREECEERIKRETARYISITELLSITHSSVSGLKCLYSCSLQHEAITPNCIFISADGRVKLGDPYLLPIQKNWTVAMRKTVVQDKQSHYLSPECIQVLKHDEAIYYDKERSDTFVMGLVLLEICNLKEYQIYDSVSKTSYLQYLQPALAEVQNRYGQAFSNLLRGMLQVEPKARPNFAQILQLVKRQTEIESQSQKQLKHMKYKEHQRMKSQQLNRQNEREIIKTRETKDLHLPSRGRQMPNRSQQIFNRTSPAHHQLHPLGKKMLDINVPTQQHQLPHPQVHFSPQRMNPPYHHQAYKSRAPIVHEPFSATKFGNINVNLNKPYDPFQDPFRVENKSPLKLTQVVYSHQIPELQTVLNPRLANYPAVNPLRQIATAAPTRFTKMLSETSLLDDISSQYAFKEAKEAISFEKPSVSFEKPTIEIESSFKEPAKAGEIVQQIQVTPRSSPRSLNLRSPRTPRQPQQIPVSTPSGQKLSPSFVIQELEKGGRYEGFMCNGLKNGHGRLQFCDGGYYQGEWKDDKMNGFGKLYYENGQVAYEGNWVDNCFSGQARVFNNQPLVCEESFDYGNFSLLNDKWIYYQGQFANDSKHGKGSIKLTNGEVFQGSFEEDMVEGEGVFYKKDGSVIEGVWKNNHLVRVVNDM